MLRPKGEDASVQPPLNLSESEAAGASWQIAGLHQAGSLVVNPA